MNEDIIYANDDNVVDMNCRSPITEDEIIADVDDKNHEDENIDYDLENNQEENLRAEKRNRIEEESEWSVIGSKKKKPKAQNNKIEIYITSTEILPKQFTIAKLLKNNNINNIERVKYISPYKIRIDLLYDIDADRLINCKDFIEKGWRIYRAMEKDLSYGVIRNVDLELTEDAIRENIICPNQAEVLSILRLLRRNTNSVSGWTPSECIRLCFKGAYMPPYVLVDGLKIKVDPYVFSVSQCSRCWRLGHMTKRCPSIKITCPKCGGNHANCETTMYKCINCEGNHMALSKSCPNYLKEKRIRELMAEYNCTYRKALTIYVAPISPPTSIMNASANTNNYNTKNNSIKTKDSESGKKPFYNFCYNNNTERKRPDTPTFADIVKTKVDVHSEESTLNLLKTDARSTPRAIKSQSRNGQVKTKEKNTEMNESSANAKETDERDDKVKFSELFIRLKEIIFLKGISVQTKINSVLKCCLEWIILAATQFLSERSLFKSVLEIFINNG
ncbi:unnamed protein product [Euphydryas editha]|uniref:CCHC-type domain-containing protein n=1 Tax=Euphydryas editha TaxID=104508 RepID=A0AAU9V6A7_EUPED|nr:unnamed protein product [Euphydryas editha]